MTHAVLPQCASLPAPPANQEPLVITASRATDIPAFYGPWFARRLQEGYCLWHNPFNAQQRVRVSFAKCRVWVFFSKNPAPFLSYLPQLEERGYQYYFHYTLNDYLAEGLEPHVPPMSRRLDAFKRLADRIGPERVLWRYDPIVLGQSLAIGRVLERIDTIGKILAPFTTALIFSYLDMYTKCAGALRKHDASLRPPDTAEMQSLAQGIAALNATWTRPLQLATCAEALDVSRWGIRKNSCVDPELILRLCPNDTALQTLYGIRRAHKQGVLVDIQGVDAPTSLYVKDKGQRKACACAPSKDIGAYNTCLHGCVYCYACQSAQVVARTLQNAHPEGESLA